MLEKEKFWQKHEGWGGKGHFASLIDLEIRKLA